MQQSRQFSLQRFITNSSLGINLALAMGRFMPAAAGYPLIRLLADFIASRKQWEIVRGARLNQWVVSGRQLSGDELDQAVREMFRNQARALFDLYRYLGNPQKYEKLLVFDEDIIQMVKDTQDMHPGQGKLLVGVHLSNFDFALQAVCRKGLRILGITVSELAGGYKRQFELRQQTGLELVTASTAGFRQAVRRLEEGGVVMSGIDRPLPESKYPVKFFGQPAYLPTHHVFLALKAGVPVIIAAICRRSDGLYHYRFSSPIPMQPHPDHRTAIIQNAEAVLAAAEDFIRQAPRQWAMFYPVWPSLLDQVPE